MARESEHQPTRLFARHRAIIARSEVELLVKILICDSRKEVQFALQKIPVQFSLGSGRANRCKGPRRLDVVVDHVAGDGRKESSP